LPGVTQVIFTIGAQPLTITFSEVSATEFAHDVASAQDAVVVRQGG